MFLLFFSPSWSTIWCSSAALFGALPFLKMRNQFSSVWRSTFSASSLISSFSLFTIQVGVTATLQSSAQWWPSLICFFDLHPVMSCIRSGVTEKVLLGLVWSRQVMQKVVLCEAAQFLLITQVRLFFILARQLRLYIPLQVILMEKFKKVHLNCHHCHLVIVSTTE